MDVLCKDVLRTYGECFRENVLGRIGNVLHKDVLTTSWERFEKLCGERFGNVLRRFKTVYIKHAVQESILNIEHFFDFPIRSESGINK